MPRDQEGTRIKGWIQSNVRFGPVSDISLQSLRKTQCWSSGSIFVSRSNRILDSNCERYWQICQRRHAGPRGRESFVEPVKSETNIKTVINKWLGRYSCWTGNGLTLKHRNPMILIVFKCQKSPLDYFDTVKKFIEKLDGAVHFWPSYWWMQEEAIRQQWKLVRRVEEGLCQCSSLVDRKMGISSGKRWRTKEKVSMLLESQLSSSIPCTFEQFKDIQEVQSILHCKTMYCYQEVFTEHIYHAGNGK